MDESVDFRSFIAILVKGWKLIFYIFVISIIIGVILALTLKTMPTQYASSAIIENAFVGSAVVDNSRLKIIMTSDDFLSPVAEDYSKLSKREVTIKSLASMIEIETIDNLTVRFLAKEYSPEKAKMLNEEILARYMEYMMPIYEQRLKTLKDTSESYEKFISELQFSVDNLQKEIKNFVHERKLTPEPAFKSIMMGNLYSQQIKQIAEMRNSQADVNTTLAYSRNFKILNHPSMPNRPKNILYVGVNTVIFSMLIGLILGIVMVFIKEYAKKTKIAEYIRNFK